ncbi:SH3 domain-binding protein 5-like isoform X1 [Oncorhynchus mykiss]|uniref:SH3 domain-binding protein 5 n=1 Tax=Oncorhynchus mykiss TaxID=8022 RepID=A0A8K9WVI5_ONCMY|nr:SH3 domain-binding protein 5-like isoform X1 [Oncorhynchus mykiss]
MEKLEKGIKPVEECESPEDDVVDPRIQGELDKLNQSTEDINRWETELEDCRQRFRTVLVEATVKLDEQVKRIGRDVEDSKPYWEARRVARQAQLEAQRATGEFQRAVEILGAAKETIALAEERLLEEDSRQFDSAWQEMLNHATNRVMEAEMTRTRSELEHRKTANQYNACISHMRQLEKKLKRTINKSRPYFELKAKYYLKLEQLKRCVDEHQAKLTVAKADYRTALRNLETISEEIHARRRSITMGTRGRGVGAEGEGDHEDITNFKMESDGLSMVSVTFDEEGGSEEETESHSTSAPLDMTSSSHHPSSSFFTPSAYLSSAPSLLSSSCPSTTEGPSPGGWLSPESRCGSGHDCTHLGPRSQCSGASSPDPDCDQERGDRAEGAEQKSGLGKLTLTITHPLHPGKDDPKGDPKTTSSPTPHNQ